MVHTIHGFTKIGSKFIINNIITPDKRFLISFSGLKTKASESHQRWVSATSGKIVNYLMVPYVHAFSVKKVPTKSGATSQFSKLMNL